MVQESRLVITIDSRNAERNARAVADELENMTVKGYKSEAQMTAMSASIKSLVGYMGGLLTINKAIAMADGYTQMAARIRNATQSAEEYALVQDRILATANTTYRALGEAQEVYLSLAGGMKSLGKTTSQTLDLVDSLSFSFTANATRSDQAQSAMDSLSKSMAKGKIDADAWISIVTGADNVIADMAKVTGKTEAEIRQLGASGKASLEDLIKTLIITRDANEQLANNMENSLADGFTKLSNEVTVFLGKANESTSATGIMAGALGELGENIEIVANAAMLGGVAYLTKQILVQTVAVQGSIAESIRKRAATTAELQAQAQLAAVEVNRTRQTASLAAQELRMAQLALINAKNKDAQALATQRLATAEIAYNIAVKNSTAAIGANTIAQDTLNASRKIGATLLGLVGGPIGAITIGVTALAAGYMYMSSKAAEANKKLEEQAEVAKKAKEELLKLKGLEKDQAIDDMTASFERQNKALSESSSKINIQLNAIKQLYAGNKEIIQVVEDAQNGTISMTDAIKRFNELRINKEIYQAIKANTTEFVKNAQEASNSKDKLSLFGIEVELAGRKAQTSAVGVNENTRSLKDNKGAADAATKAQKDFKASLFDKEFEAVLTSKLLGKGYTPEQVTAMVNAANWARKEGVTITNEMYQAALQIVSIEEKNKAVIDARNSTQKESTKELERQQKILQVNAKVQANAAKYNFNSIEDKYNLPRGTLSAIHAIETGNTGKTNQVNQTTGATGGFQFLSGTAKQYGVNDRMDLAQSAEGAGKYMAYLLKLFKGDLEKAVRAYHAGEGNVQKGKNIGKYNNDYWNKYQSYMAGINGYSSSDISSKDFEKLLEDSTKLLEEQAKARKALELDVANEVTKIRENLKDKLEEIDKAGFSQDQAKKLKAEYQTRAENEIAIAEYALKTKLDDYASFKKSEEDLLKDSFDQKKFYASRDIELSKDQRDEAVALLNDQYQHELALIKLSQEQRLFQAKQSLLSETQAMQERYRLEREEIALNSKLSQDERNKLIQLSKAAQDQEIRDGLNSAYQNWGQTQANMMGTSAMYGLLQERESRYTSSQDVFDAEMANVDMQSQDPNANLEELAAQREAIWQAHNDRMRMIDEDYWNKTKSYQLGMAADVFGGLSGVMLNFVDESSSSYRALVAIQKGANLASVLMNSVTAISAAWASAPFPYNMPAVAMATLETGALQATLQAFTPQGFSSGGYTGSGAKYTPAGVVHKGEVVWSQDDIKRWGGVGVVESMRTSSPGGYADGGIALDAPKVLSFDKGQDVGKYIAEARESNSSPIVNLNPNFVIVDERESLGDYLFGPDGKKAFVKFFKRNQRELGFA